MAKSITVLQKKRGRPATGQDPVMTIRLPLDLRARIERWAGSKDLTRSEAIRALLERALKK